MVKRIQIIAEDDKWEELDGKKNGRTWLEMLEDGAEADDV